MHPNCRSTTVEYDPEDAADWAVSGEPMPEDMTYEEWKKRQDETEATKMTGGPYSVDWEKIRTDEYRQKFNGITEDETTDARLHQRALDMLEHRDGTAYEDMYLFKAGDYEPVGVQTHSAVEFEVTYNESVERAITKHPDYSLVVMHNHPNDLPPSGSDFSACGRNKYKIGVVVCFNGDVYIYKAGKRPFSAQMFDLTVDKYRKPPYNLSELEAYKKRLISLNLITASSGR